ncbi:hypothetical protein BX666DRAFT_2122896 [Dichotomocladium elegans]|nr:hypothetical protein BX666DRAFT_2122896 [Dichotomocladium elegans]
MTFAQNVKNPRPFASQFHLESSNQVYHVGNGVVDPELRGPPLFADVPISSISDYNLAFYLRRYWIRQTQKSNIDINRTLHYVAPKLYYNNNIYDSMAYPTKRTKRLTHFVTVMLPVDVNYKNRRAVAKDIRKRFFAEAVLFFAHSHEGETKVLCLLRLIERLAVNGAGVPFGTSLSRTRYYVADADYIDDFAGAVKSSVYPNRVYYVYRGMDIEKVGLGNTADLRP